MISDEKLMNTKVVELIKMYNLYFFDFASGLVHPYEQS